MPLYGYARVSTVGQDLAIQEAALRAAGCLVVRAEKQSGATRSGRSELTNLLDFVQPGDTLVVTRIDRLARSLKDLQDIVVDLKARGVSIKATEQPVDTSSAAGKAFLDMLGVFAEFETNLRRERQREGIEAAKAKGVYKRSGRRRSVDREEVRRLQASGMRLVDIARQLGCGRTSVYRALGLIENKNGAPLNFEDLSALLRNKLAGEGIGSLDTLLTVSDDELARIGLRPTDLERVRGLSGRALAAREERELA